jgi:uncharacterized protein
LNSRVPVVDHLVLGDEPHLVARRCTACGAKYLARRTECAGCGSTDIAPFPLPVRGQLRTFALVRSEPSTHATSYLAGVVACGGMIVPAAIVDVPPGRMVSIGMPVRLTTMDLPADDTGRITVGFGFTPA